MIGQAFGRGTHAEMPVNLAGAVYIVGLSGIMNHALSVFMQFAGLPLHEAITAATVNPGRLLRRSEICLQVTEGQPANLVFSGLTRPTFRSKPCS